MKIIEGMKKIKELQEKASDYRSKIQKYHADLDYETPIYGDDQRKQIDEWLQGHSDLMKEILALRVSIQKTNLQTEVPIEIGGKQVTKTIAEWIHRRRDLAESERMCWEKLNDKNLRDGRMEMTSGEKVDVKIRRYYDPKERDEKIELFRSEPSIIDRTLEVVNATTDLVA